MREPYLIEGMCVHTEHLGPDDFGPRRIRAIHKRDTDVTYSTTWGYDDDLSPAENAIEVVTQLLETWDMKECSPGLGIRSMGWDYDHYYFVLGEG